MSASRSCSLKISGNDWEALCPELFALILKAIQQNAGQDAGEARRVVAMAGVCRRWRHLVQQSYTSPLAEIGLLQFPFALRQPGPSNRPVQCLLKRHGSCFILFQDNGGRGEKLDFLMAARKKFKPYGCCHVISASHKSFSTTGHAYMGKLKSDFWASEFRLWEVSGNQSKCKRLATRVNFFDRVAGGFRQRAMSCELFPFKKNLRQARSLPEKSNSRYEIIANNHRNFLQRWSCFSPAAPKATRVTSSFLRSYSSLSRSGKFLDGNNSKAAHSATSTRSRELIPMDSMMMKSKVPEWDDERQCWSLNFHGRSTLPSSYTFQLVQSNPQGGQNDHSLPSTNTTEAAPGEQIIFLQLGKVGKCLYTVDFCHPLSAFQAFAICLSSFATKVGLEP